MKTTKIFSIITTLIITLFAFGSLKASAASLDLSEQQKQEYYKQYKEIVEEINSGNPNATLELVPFEEYKSEDYVEPSEFEKYATERASVNFVNISESRIQPRSTAYGTKTKDVSSNGAKVTITVKGSFETQYESYYQRQMFTRINSITSSASKGSWSQTGYTPSLIDGGRTYSIIVGGKLTINGLISSHNVTVPFYCDSKGSIS